MWSVEGEIGPDGCIVSVELSVPVESELGSGATVVCAGMIDTGADTSCIAPEVVSALGIGPRRLDWVQTPGDPNPRLAPLHWLQVAVTKIAGAKSKTLGRPIPARMFEIVLPSQRFMAIVGRDVLSELEFGYNGPERRFTLRAKS
jgi:hypothetical protein